MSNATWFELKKTGGSHVRSIKRMIIRRINNLPHMKEYNVSVRAKIIQIIRKPNKDCEVCI